VAGKSCSNTVHSFNMYPLQFCIPNWPYVHLLERHIYYCKLITCIVRNYIFLFFYIFTVLKNVHLCHIPIYIQGTPLACCMWKFMKLNLNFIYSRGHTRLIQTKIKLTNTKFYQNPFISFGDGTYSHVNGHDITCTHSLGVENAR
jgi:hypothetical protein